MTTEESGQSVTSSNGWAALVVMSSRTMDPEDAANEKRMWVRGTRMKAAAPSNEHAIDVYDDPWDGRHPGTIDQRNGLMLCTAGTRRWDNQLCLRGLCRITTTTTKVWNQVDSGRGGQWLGANGTQGTITKRQGWTTAGYRQGWMTAGYGQGWTMAGYEPAINSHMRDMGSTVRNTTQSIGCPVEWKNIWKEIVY
ncbi:hypothetical protein BU15DRAFT_60561 [Melanogaster broomeanus]|nr:hypothetical protein BU15DRAFT_60533 [Melanogaster broomeanus]KAF9242050.1 hypothetical protein BU15DRAFT_60561 [Melanogaster broomeanus]